MRPEADANGNEWIVWEACSTGAEEKDPGAIYLWKVGTPSSDAVRLTSDWINHAQPDLFIPSGGPTKPGVVTKDATNVTTSAARLNGEITSTGGENSTVKVYWGDNDGGTAGSSWDHGEGLGTRGVGTYHMDVSGLASNTTYYYRCWAGNSAGGTWAPSSPRTRRTS